MQYDFLIVGGGCAGLSLAYHLQHAGLLDKHSLLIVDREHKTHNDRTWSFWTDESTLFDHLVYRQWERIEIRGPQSGRIFTLPKMRYKTIRGIDFYEETLGKLRANPNVHFRYGEVGQVLSNAQGARIEVDGQWLHGQWAFDSRFDASVHHAWQPGYHYLLQHFKGYVLKTPQASFDTSHLTMFDFRVEQEDGVHFFYILPFAPDSALVEYTVFSKKLLPMPLYTERLEKYLSETLQITDYQIEEEEFGVIPMTDYPFLVQPSPRVLRIGVGSGQARPSTGYAFLRIQRDSARIARSLLHTGQPVYSRPAFGRRFGVYDALLLNIMHRAGHSVADIFIRLFERNPTERILRFLDDRSQPWEELLIMASVKPFPFLRSIKNVYLSGKLVK